MLWGYVRQLLRGRQSLLWQGMLQGAIPLVSLWFDWPGWNCWQDSQKAKEFGRGGYDNRGNFCKFIVLLASCLLACSLAENVCVKSASHVSLLHSLFAFVRNAHSPKVLQHSRRLPLLELPSFSMPFTLKATKVKRDVVVKWSRKGTRQSAINCAQAGCAQAGCHEVKERRKGRQQKATKGENSGCQWVNERRKARLHSKQWRHDHTPLYPICVISFVVAYQLHINDNVIVLNEF